VRHLLAGPTGAAVVSGRSHKLTTGAAVVRVYCTHELADRPWPRQCMSQWDDHVHQPIPCENGHDERHHAFVYPKSVSVWVAGELHRVKLRRQVTA